MAVSHRMGWMLAVVLSASGCAISHERIDEDPVEVVPTAPSSRVRSSSGWLDHARSPITPFCQAVLIAPDVVVTAFTCVEDGWSELSFGWGEPGGPTVPVAGMRLHPEAGEGPDHAIVALRLERPVPDVVPARLVPMREAPCGVELPTEEARVRSEGTRGVRSTWGACGMEDEGHLALVATDGFPSCHGDSGAGAFLPGDEDAVIGWVTSAGHLGSPNPLHPICVSSVGLASVADNVEFLEWALEMSRVQDAP